MKKKFSVYVILSLIVSVVLGIVLQDYKEIANGFSPLGTIYVNLIKMIMVPLVFSSLVGGVSSIGDLRRLGKMGIVTVITFLGTTAIAVSIGLILSILCKPGVGVTLIDGVYEISDFPSIIETFVNIVPSNPLAALTEGNMLQIIFFSVILGIGLVKTGNKAQGLNNVIESLYETMSSITKGIMYLTPVGILGLMVPVVANNGVQVLLPLLKVIVVFYIAVVIQAGIVYCSLIKIMSNVTIKDFFKGLAQAQIIAFTTCSSAAALPVTIKQVQDELKISKEVSSFVLPLGSTINMDGNALYQGIVALFIAQVYGVELTIPMMLMVILTGTLASIGAAGVPGAGMIVLSTVLLSVGLPVDGIVLVAGIDRILDMGRTFINVTGDAVTACVVDKFIGKHWD